MPVDLELRPGLRRAAPPADEGRIALADANLPAAVQHAGALVAGVEEIAGKPDALETEAIGVPLDRLLLELGPVAVVRVALGDAGAEPVVHGRLAGIEVVAREPHALDGDAQRLARPVPDQLHHVPVRVVHVLDLLVACLEAVAAELEQPPRREQQGHPGDEEERRLEEEGVDGAPEARDAGPSAVPEARGGARQAEPARLGVGRRVALHPDGRPHAHQGLGDAHAELGRQHPGLRERHHRLHLEQPEEEATGRLPEEADRE
mmetsp:Transcript_59327/g.167106  ORF Transcript_59327/g.167106 Transcript_59327/m.167106 type:complete len:262 (-) Transcript_59327:429-1214(-)